MLEELTPEEVHQKYADNEIILIDVRTPIEFAFERIHGALNAPMATLDPKKLPADSRTPIVLHCGSGMRSAKVGALLLQNGFDHIAHMKGGLGAWKQAKLPTVAVDPVTGNIKL